MPKKIYLLVLLLATGVFGFQFYKGYVSKHHLSSVDDKLYSDGPYVFIQPNSLSSLRIKNGAIIEHQLSLDSLPIQFVDEISTYKSNGKITVLSDIHGQHDVFVNLIKKNNIIDDNDNWSYGNGHFVITGDIFDRGSNVIETLWLIKKLEKQAIDDGGKVHYLLGNHEYMVLQGDERYLHEKYLKTSAIFGKPYKYLFGKNTVLGRWLRSKSTVIKIDDTLFTHGGLSLSFSNQETNLQDINSDYRKTIDMSRNSIKASDQFAKYHDSESPIWYRGYFSNELTSKQLTEILSKYDAKRIVVGHTSQDEIKSLNNGKVFAVDTSMKLGKTGQLLFLEKGKALRGKFNGDREQL